LLSNETRDTSYKLVNSPKINIFFFKPEELS
jgi:hypothetical protein